MKIMGNLGVLPSTALREKFLGIGNHNQTTQRAQSKQQSVRKQRRNNYCFSRGHKLTGKFSPSLLSPFLPPSIPLPFCRGNSRPGLPTAPNPMLNPRVETRRPCLPFQQRQSLILRSRFSSWPFGPICRQIEMQGATFRLQSSPGNSTQQPVRVRRGEL